MAAAIRCVCPKMRGVLEHIYELANSWRKVAKVQVHSHCFASGTLYMIMIIVINCFVKTFPYNFFDFLLAAFSVVFSYTYSFL